MRAFYASALPPWGVMRPIVALVLLSSVAAVGSVLKAQERAPTGAPPTFAARAAGSSSGPAATPTLSPAAGFETLVKPFLAENCYGCHGNKKHKKDLNFEAIESVESLVTDGDRWDDVVQKLRARDMPPEDEPQPAEHQRQAVATWIARELARIEKATPPDPGRITARRLNRTEYNNTIKELLGVDTHPADDFPQDDAGYGFDNIADVLSLSPVLMEKYITAGERVARTALFGSPTLKPTLARLRSDGRKVHEVQAVPDIYDVTGLSMPNAFHAIHRVPVDGDYVIRVALGGVRPAGSSPVTVALWIDERQVATVAPRSGTRRNLRRRSAGLRRSDDGVQGQAHGRGPLDFGRGAADFRGPARALCRTESVDAAGPGGEAIQAAARRHAGADRPAAKGVRRDPGRAREAAAERRSRRLGRRRRPLLPAGRPVTRESRRRFTRAGISTKRPHRRCARRGS